MSSTIKIEDFWKGQTSLILGLSIQSSEKFPIVVGCSLQTDSGEIVDIPARFLLSPGYVFWGRESVDHRFKYPRDAQGLYEVSGWNGRIIFALYSDSSFKNRLADTGWIKWETSNRIGGSTAGLNDEDEIMEHILNTKYFVQQKNVWSSLEDNTPIEVW